jgi:signal transduction histidine kinase
MHDEIQDTYEAIFNRIIRGLILISLVAGLITFFTDGVASPWFIRAGAVLLLAVVAFGLRLFGKFIAAASLLMLELFGLMVELLLRPGAFTGFAPYLLVPIVIITGLLFSPLVTFIVTAAAILLILLLMALTGQFNWTNLGLLLPALLLSLFTAMVSSEYHRRLLNLGQRLRENRTLLKDRTRKIMENARNDELNQRQILELQQQLAQAKVELVQTQHRLSEGDDRFYHLLRGTVETSEQALKQLEQELERAADQQPAFSLEPLWRRTDDLKSLLINLQELLQVEHGELSLSYQAIDVKQLLHELAGMARGLARHKPIDIRVHTAAKLPVLQADLLRVRQALIQLLHNAITYTEQGLIELQAEVVNDEFRIFVSDTGAGIPREALSRIFEIFDHGNNHHQDQGAGLGLALTRRLIELHGGRVWANSILGVGSTFYLALPLKPEPAPASPALPLPLATPIPAPIPATPSSSERPAPQAAPHFAMPDDPDQTMISSRWAAVQPEPYAGPTQMEPIRRFGQIYVRRLSLILLALLVVILGVVTVLAVINGPTEQQAGLETPPRPASPTAAALLLPSSTPQPTILAATATASPTPLPSDTATSLPPTPSPTLTVTPTEEPSPTPSPTATASPTPLAVNPLLPATLVTVNGSPLAFGVEQVDLLAGSSGTPVKTANDSRLSWSRTGHALFTGEQANDREIYRLGRQNDRPLNLSAAIGDDLQPAWSPDGRQIAFSSARSGNFDIYLMRADGGNPVALTSSRGYDEWPAWSPDGRQIAFISDRDGNAEIYLMQTDGSNLRRLTNHPADDWPAAWSPDGQRLVFASNRDEDWNLYIVSAEGGPALRLTNAPGDEREPVWSSDGQSIAFAYNDGQGWDIYTLPAPAGAVAETPPDLWSRVTQTPIDERYPVWLPDARAVAP